jgi:hypothetical protein
MQEARHDPIMIKYQSKNQFQMEHNLYFQFLPKVLMIYYLYNFVEYYFIILKKYLKKKKNVITNYVR